MGRECKIEQNMCRCVMMESIASGERKGMQGEGLYVECNGIVAAVLLFVVTLLLNFNVIRVAWLAVNGLRPRHASEMRQIKWCNTGKG